jgi:hypothetical protein
MEGFEYFFKILVTNLKYNSCSIIYEWRKNGVRGGKDMKFSPTKNKENPYFALESDSGGFHKRFFNWSWRSKFNKISSWATLFEPYLIHKFVKDILELILGL